MDKSLNRQYPCDNLRCENRSLVTAANNSRDRRVTRYIGSNVEE